MYTHSREFPCMYPAMIHTGSSPVCILCIPVYITRTHIQHNCINVKITKLNAAIEYKQKVTVAEPKAMPVVWIPLKNVNVLHAL